MNGRFPTEFGSKVKEHWKGHQPTAEKTNKFNQKFKPVLVGVATIHSMHSPNEKMEVESLSKGYEFIKEIFLAYNV